MTTSAESAPFTGTSRSDGSHSISQLQAAGRISALDGLRGVAVLMVVVLHYYVVVPGPENSVLHHFLQRAGSLFYCGVDLFFVLSGYFIGGILLDHRDSPRLLPAFFARRFFRIVPLYVLLLASFFLCRQLDGLSVVNHGTYFSSGVPEWSYFCFVQNIAMAGLRDIGPYWLGPTWSLAVEEQFYLLMPWMVLRSNPRQLVRLCLFLIPVCAAFRISALVYAQNSAAAVFLLPARADGLLCGVLCAVAVRNGAALAWLKAQRHALSAGIAGMALALGMFSLGKFGADSAEVAMFGYSALSIFFAAIVLHVVSSPVSRLSRVLSFRPLAGVGLTSYFVYLFHTPIWYLLHWFFFRRPPLHFTWAAGAVTCAAVVTTLLLSWVSWRCFERPLLRFARRFSYR